EVAAGDAQERQRVADVLVHGVEVAELDRTPVLAFQADEGVARGERAAAGIHRDLALELEDRLQVRRQLLGAADAQARVRRLHRIDGRRVRVSGGTVHHRGEADAG